MPSSTAGARAANPAQAQQQGQQTDWKWQVGKMMIFWMGAQAVIGPNGLISYFTGNKADSATPTPVTSEGMAHPSSVPLRTPPHVQREQQLKRFGGAESAAPLWNLGEPLDLYLFVTTAPAPSSADIASQYSDLAPDGVGPGNALDRVDFSYLDFLDATSESDDGDTVAVPEDSSALPIVQFKGFSLGDPNLHRVADVTFPIPDEVRLNNASLWADMFLTRRGVSPNPKRLSYAQDGVVHVRKLLTRLFPKRKLRSEKSLFKRGGNDTSSSEADSAEEADADPANDKHSPLVTHWHRNLSLALVQDGNAILPLAKMPPPILQHVHLESTRRRDATGQHVLAAPVLFPNDFWLLREHMMPINETVHELSLHVDLSTSSYFKFQMFAALQDSFDRQAAGGGSGAAMGAEMDMVKTMLLETNPWFLGLTMAVTLLHSLFEFLAFSSEVSHWRNKKDMIGVSLGSILTNIFVQLIILLYLLDNNEETSWMILASQGVGLLIEAWKITKAVAVNILPAPAGSMLPYRIQVINKHVLSTEEQKTQEYDRLAFKYVSWIAGPLLCAYTIYSAIYETHRGWWSFVIGTLTSFVYAFGFVSLIPQLIVNYKLKSVAHINTKAFVYKILGTFVDDLFAFCIKMPLLHRLACFRDDVVFFVFIYQWWIYPTDKSRVNEFGQVSEPEAGAPAIEGAAIAGNKVADAAKKIEDKVQEKDKARKRTGKAQPETAGAGSTDSVKVEGKKEI